MKKNYRVLFKTSEGNFEVELNAENYPLTVTNFLENIKKDIYENKRFYKIINYPQGKVIHAGIFQEKNKFLDNNQVIDKRLPTIPLEISFSKTETIYGHNIKDLTEIENMRSLFKRGSIAMVKSGESNSSSTEFFFVTHKMPELHGRYSIFGHITNGFEVLENIDNDDVIYKINITN